jgi:hypothetical protein
MQLKESAFNLFPGQSPVTQKVFEHYYDIGFINKQMDSLNDAQKVLCYHFVCDGLIDNSGFQSILLETNGEFNAGYARALDLIGDTTDKKIFDEIVSVYNKYEKWFSKQTNPPALDEDSKEFDKKLYARIEELQKKWYANGSARGNLFKEYIRRHKDHLVEKE